MVTFAEWLRWQMAARLLSPELVAHELGVPELFVLAWLAGTNAPGRTPCRLLARLFRTRTAGAWALAQQTHGHLNADEAR